MRKLSLTGILSFLVLVWTLTGFARGAAAQQNVIGIEVPSPTAEVLAPEVTPLAPFAKFSAFASGGLTTSLASTNCTNAGVTCDSGTCNGCFTFSDLPLKGVMGTTISGEMIIENSTRNGDCYVSHGVAVAAAKAFTINFGIAGHLCYQPSLSPDDLQFTGNYIVRGGTGAYGAAAGTGSFTTDFPASLGTETRSLSMNGVIQK
jgi:hypothetical protein